MSITITSSGITLSDATSLTTAPIASTNVNDIGSMAMACVPGSSGLYCDFGGTVAGTNLTPACMIGTSSTMQWYRGSSIGVGTWRCLGYAGQSQGSGYRPYCLWVRIS